MAGTPPLPAGYTDRGSEPPLPKGYTDSSSEPPLPRGYTDSGAEPPLPAGYTENQPISPRPTYTGNYDGIITAQARNHKIDPALVRAVIGRESHGDPGAVSKAGAVGLMQLEPSTFAEMGVGSNPHDPTQNIAAGTKYLAQMLERYHGDTRLALAAYNAGPGNVKSAVPDNGETAEYVRNVMADYNHYKSATKIPDSAPKNIHTAGVGPVADEKAKRAADMYARGMSPGQIAAKMAPGARNLQHFEAALAWARQHPMDVLSTGERAAGGFEWTVLTSHNWPEVFQRAPEAMKQFAFHSTPTLRAEATEAERTVAHAAVHLPTDQQINEFADHIIPPQFRKQFTTLATAGADITAQNLADPLNIIPVGAVAHLLGSQVRVLSDAAKAAGVGKLFQHLGPVSKSLSDIGSKIHHDFTVRPDLDSFFSKEDKSRRLSIENSEAGNASRWRTEDEKILHDPKAAAQRYLNHYAPQFANSPINVGRAFADAFGLQGKELRDAVEHFRGLAPDAQKVTLEELRKARDVAQARRIASMTTTQREDEFARIRQRLVKQNVTKRSNEVLKFKTDAPHTNMSQIELSPSARLNTDSKVVQFLTSKTRGLARQMVQLVPFPHALWNVGQLAYLAGGPEALMRGVFHMAKGLSPKQIGRLREIGAEAAYTHNLNNFHLAGVTIPNPSKLLNPAATRIELAWRQALLEQLDRRLGPSTSKADELLKGHLVSDAVGDYRNQTAFVRFFQAIGGPFVAFGLGIVPPKVLGALATHPERVENILRTEEDVQNRRPDKGVNVYDIGGPVGDVETAVRGPSLTAGVAKYMTSPSRLGILGDVMQQAEARTAKGGVDTLAEMLEMAFPEIGMASQFGDIAVGRGMPTIGRKGQSAYESGQTFADKLSEMLMRALTSSRYRRPQSKSQQKVQANAPYRSL